MKDQTWLILGAGSSISRAFARQVAARGAKVLLAGRDAADLAVCAADITVRSGVAAEALAFDALDFDSHVAFLRVVRDRADGALNVLLAFGLMPDQAEMEADFSLARACVDSNYLGAVSILSRLAHLFEIQGGGRLVVLGSVAGDRGRRRNYVYGSAKAGLHAFTDGLRARLHRAGVSVTLVKPGFVDTAMTWGQPGLFLVATPHEAARQILRHGLRGANRCYVPGFWALIMTVVRLIPEPLFKRLGI